MTEGSAHEALARLAAAPHRFDFFEALRILDAAHADRPRLGHGRRAADEPVRLGQPPHLAFPPSDIAGYQAKGAGPPRLATFVLGLFGPHGPLPLHLTVHARDRMRRHQDRTFADFCDVFHHRMLTFFYRAWAMARPTVEQDRPAEDRFAHRVGALAGLATPAFLGHHALPDRMALFGAGLLAKGTRPPEVVSRLVAAFLGVGARVEEFVGGWLDIPVRDRARLGTARLALDAVLGRQRFERGHRFRLELGPLSFDEFRGLLPDGPAVAPLRALVRLAAGIEHDWDMRLRLRAAEVPAARLDGRSRLGWTSWLWLTARRHDAGDLVLEGGNP